MSRLSTPAAWLPISPMLCDLVGGRVVSMPCRNWGGSQMAWAPGGNPMAWTQKVGWGGAASGQEGLDLSVQDGK